MMRAVFWTTYLVIAGVVIMIGGQAFLGVITDG